MSEAEWLACTQPLLMLKPFRHRLTPRKRCLLACAYVLHSPGGFTVGAVRRVVEAARAAALAVPPGRTHVAATCAAVAPLLPNGFQLTRWNLWSPVAHHRELGAEGRRLANFLGACVYEPTSPGSVNFVASDCLRAIRVAADAETVPALSARFDRHGRRVTSAFKEEVFALIPEPARSAEREKEWEGGIPNRIRGKVCAAAARPRIEVASAALAGLAREVLGNPFHPPKIEPAWLTWNHGAARHIAETIAATGDFSDLPILADALEDAGCRDEHLLAHCRGSHTHVPGCWAIDAVLRR